MKDWKQILGQKANETKRKAISDIELLQLFLSQKELQMIPVKRG